MVDTAPIDESIWARVVNMFVSDDMEFFMFLGLSRESFSELVGICETNVLKNPLDRDCGKPKERPLKRRSYGSRGIMAITIKWLCRGEEFISSVRGNVGSV